MNNQIYDKLHHVLDNLLILHIASDKNVLASHGLRRARFYTLRHLFQNPGLTITRLSGISFADLASTSRIVRSLEKEGLVQRQSDDSDRRLFFLSLTDAGTELYEEANAELRVDIQRRFSSIDSEKLSDILESVQALSEAIAQYQKDQEIS
jgi:DNA-binding MarR family transcriptional regulator